MVLLFFEYNDILSRNICWDESGQRPTFFLFIQILVLIPSCNPRKKERGENEERFSHSCNATGC